MKLLGAVFYVFAVLAFVGSALGDGEGGDLGSQTASGGASPGTGARVCPMDESTVTKDIMTIIFNKQTSYCKQISLSREMVREFDSLKTWDEFRNFYKVFCEKQEKVIECFAGVQTNFTVCENEFSRNVFNIFFNVYKKLSESACENEGELLATLYYGIVAIEDKRELWSDTFEKFETVMKVIRNSAVDDASRIFLTYEEFVAIKTRFSRLDVDDSVKTQMGSFMDIVLTNMQCIHPHDGTLVLCSAIDPASLTMPDICVLKTNSEPGSSLQDILKDDGGRCVAIRIMYDFRLNQPSDDITTLRKDSKNYCLYSTFKKTCVGRLEVFAEMCLNETDQKDWKHVQDFMVDASETGCLDEGARIADILQEVYRLKRTSTETPDAVRKCISIAKSTRKQNHREESSSPSLRFYRELEAFKKCFLNKLHGDNTAVKAAESLLYEVLRKVKCSHPGDGTTVLCETIVNN